MRIEESANEEGGFITDQSLNTTNDPGGNMDDLGVELVEFRGVKEATIGRKSISLLIEDGAFVSGLEELVLKPLSRPGQFFKYVNAQFKRLD